MDRKCQSKVKGKTYSSINYLTCRTMGQIHQKCNETSNLMWLSLICFISVLFVFFWDLSCKIENLKIKCVTETKNVSVLFCKHLTLRFLYILGCSGPLCVVRGYGKYMLNSCVAACHMYVVLCRYVIAKQICTFRSLING